MINFHLHDVFIIKNYGLQTGESIDHDHNFFEIIFVEEGGGYDTLNGKNYEVHEHGVFLIAPEDNFKMTANIYTRLHSFKFTEMLFSNKVFLPDRTHWLQKIEHILHHPNLINGDCIKHEEDKKLIWHIHEVILKEYDEKKEYYQHIISNMVSTILSIIVRNISEKYKQNDVVISNEVSKINEILHYIREHIYEANLIKIDKLAAQFNMSVNYIGTYFKKHTKKSLHQFIMDYKLQLVKYRLKNTDFTISEIAYQLGFTDESHLTRTFKKRFEMTPTNFKKMLN